MDSTDRLRKEELLRALDEDGSWIDSILRRDAIRRKNGVPTHKLAKPMADEIKAELKRRVPAEEA